LTAKALGAEVRFVIELALFVLSQEASEKSIYKSGIVAGYQRAHIKAAPERVVYPGNDLQKGRDDRRRDADGHSFRQMNFDGVRKHVFKSGQAHLN
jgi:hypothetical protein